MIPSFIPIKKGRLKGCYWTIFSGKGKRGLLLRRDDTHALAAWHPSTNFFLGMPRGHRGFVDSKGTGKGVSFKTWQGWKDRLARELSVAPPKEYTI
jgi:hypothetical protein